MDRHGGDKTAIFTTMPVGRALSIMALPTIASQLVTLIYNITDTWFIGRTNDPFMVSAASMVATVFLMIITLSNIDTNSDYVIIIIFFKPWDDNCCIKST